MNYIRSYVMNAISLPKNERGFTLVELLILILKCCAKSG